MAAQTIPPYIPLETYFAFEEEAETKSEYYDGVIVAMSGASQPHVEITRNISSEAAIQLRTSSCRWYPGDLRIYSDLCNSVFFPDLTVACDTPRFANTRLATLLNPTLIVEVLSPSTEAKDRGEKFECYRAIVSLVMYVLVAQDRPLVEVFTRQADGSWRLDAYRGLDAIVPLPAISCRLCLKDVYANVMFPPPPRGTNTEDMSPA